MENTPTPEIATPKVEPKNISRIGKYTVVELKELENIRILWKNEAQDFTKWMSDSKNLERLGGVLDFEFDPGTIRTESKSGQSNRRCDIVARLRTGEDDDDTEGEIVAIENQVEATDFSHLGRLILYAALEKATRIVWVVKEATNDHRKAIAWLNENTTDSLRFYLVEVVVYAFKDSQVAPTFRLIEWPDEEEKVQRSGTPKRRANFDFWKGFLAANREKLDRIISCRQPLPENWYGIAIGTSKCHINLEYSKKQVKIVIVTEDSERATFKKLESKLAELRKAVGDGYKVVTSDENVKQPLFRFFGPECDIQKKGDNGVSKAYTWLVEGLERIIPIVKESLNIR